MPSVMIYIRQQDYDKWMAIENKPDWFHEKLNEPPHRVERAAPKPVRVTKPEETA